MKKYFSKRKRQILDISKEAKFLRSFFSILFLFHELSRFTGQQEKREAISLTPVSHFKLLRKHLDIIQAITAESSPLQIASRWTRTWNLWLIGASH